MYIRKKVFLVICLEYLFIVEDGILGGVIWSRIFLVVLNSGIISINIVIEISFIYKILVFWILDKRYKYIIREKINWNKNKIKIVLILKFILKLIIKMLILNLYWEIWYCLR